MTDFSAIEARIAAAALRKLRNATATLDGGKLVDGLFLSPEDAAFNGLLEANRLSFEALSGDLVGVSVGSTLTLRGVLYRVSGHPRDRVGITTLELEQA